MGLDHDEQAGVVAATIGGPAGSPPAGDRGGDFEFVAAGVVEGLAVSPGAKAALWLAGAVIVVLLLESAPKIGGAVLLLLTVYLAIEAMRKGVV